MSVAIYPGMPYIYIWSSAKEWGDLLQKNKYKYYMGASSSRNGYFLVPCDEPDHLIASPEPPPSLVCAYTTAHDEEEEDYNDEYDVFTNNNSSTLSKYDGRNQTKGYNDNKNNNNSVASILSDSDFGSEYGHSNSRSNVKSKDTILSQPPLMVLSTPSQARILADLARTHSS